jgi:hypothetical protein
MQSRASLVAVGVAIALSAVLADRTFAAVSVTSQKLVSGAGRYWLHTMFGSIPISEPTVYTEAPFPNDASNHATVDQTGLHVLVNLSGSATGKPMQTNYQVRDNWDSKRFEIVFQLNQPATYKYHGEMWSPSYLPQLPPTTLSGPGGSIDFSAAAFVRTLDAEGVLQPGTYTFSGTVGYDYHSGPQNLPNPGMISGLQHTTLDIIVPEPGFAAGVVTASVLLASGRRRRPLGA